MAVPIFTKLTQNISNNAVTAVNVAGDSKIAQLTTQAALISTVAETITSSKVNILRANSVVTTAPENTTLYGIDNGTTAVVSTYARWAKFRDAGATLTETTIPIGTIVSGIVICINLSSTTAKVQGRVWRRPLSSATLNAAPGVAVDDLLIIDTGIVALSAEYLSMVSAAEMFLNVPVSRFEILSGYTYGFDFQFFDSSDAVLAGTAKYVTTTALASRHAGFVYTTTGASSFSGQTTTRPIRMGYATSTTTSDLATIEQKASRKIFATANSSKLTDLERRAIVRQGAWSGPDKIIRPNYPTHRMGLARLGLTDGTYGIDFGPRISPDTMSDMSTIPGVSTATAGQYRFGVVSTNTPKGAVYSGYKDIATRSVYAPYANWARLFLSDCYMDGQAVVGSPVTMQQVLSSATKLPYVELEHCDFRRYGAGMGNIYNGAIRRCLILHSGANAIQVQQDYANGSHLTLEQNLFCYVGTADAGADPASHSDVLEMNRAQGLSAVGNVYYLPSTGTTYDPGQYGTTNCIRHSSDGTSAISNIYHLGELILGGNSPVGLHMRHDLTVSNILFAFNKYGGYDYVIYNNQIEIRGPGSGESTKTVDWCNLAFFDEWQVDGSPMSLGDGTGWTQYNAIPANYYTRPANPYRNSEQKWGVFSWDKARATPKFIESLQLVGLSTGRTILDSNNDLNPEYNLGALKSTYA